MRPRRTALTAVVCAAVFGGCTSGDGNATGDMPRPTATSSPSSSDEAMDDFRRLDAPAGTGPGSDG